MSAVPGEQVAVQSYLVHHFGTDAAGLLYSHLHSSSSQDKTVNLTFLGIKYHNFDLAISRGGSRIDLATFHFRPTFMLREW